MKVFNNILTNIVQRRTLVAEEEIKLCKLPEMNIYWVSTVFGDNMIIKFGDLSNVIRNI